MQKAMETIITELIKFLEICQDSVAGDKIDVSQYKLLTNKKIEFITEMIKTEKRDVFSGYWGKLTMLLTIDKYICCFEDRACC